MSQNTPDSTGSNDTDLREALAERTQMAQDLADQLRAREAQLAEFRTRAERLERRGSIERSLAQAGAIDTEALALLVESRLEGDDDTTPQRVIAQLQRDRPALFRAPSRASAISPSHPSQGTSGRLSVERAREEARTTGDRRALMKYLRLRRAN
ncbi:MAG: hypothetical protein KIT54_00935 [Phycisphaeraceae bacterium]|nr:hypothetical protein [Phycisphaeraceae bacterium]